MKYGIFTGRFQPPHYGHIKAIQKIAKKVKTIVALVSPTKTVNTGALHPARNPFTFEERKRMILDSLSEMGFNANNLKVVPLHPILPKKLWKKDLSRLPKNRCWYIVKKGGVEEDSSQILKKEGENVKRFVLTNYMRNFNSKEIRRRMIMNENWQELVPDAVKKIILDIDGVNRVKSLYKEYGDVVFSKKEDWFISKVIV